MSFDERYQLLELAGDEGAKTFVARETSTGKKVTVFLFVGEQVRAQADFIVRLRAVDRARFPELIETGDNRGTPFVVTEPISGLSELKNRLFPPKAAPQEMQAHKPEEFSKAGVWHVPATFQSAPGEIAKVPRESSTADLHRTAQASSHGAPGSFTQMFRIPAAPIDEPVPERTKVPTTPAAPLPTQPAPGSFTQMFQAPAAPIGEPVPERTEAPMPPVQPKREQSGPGEFTRFFSAASSSAPAPTPMPQKSESQGEFARIFGNGDRATAPGTVTGIFGAPSSAAPQKQVEIAPTPPPAYAPPRGEFSKIFGDTAIGIPAPGIMAPMPTPGAAPPPSSSPGEYTRIFSAQPPAQEPLGEPVPAPIGTQEATAPAQRPSKMIIPVLIGIILLLLAAIVAIVITMRK